MDKKFFKEIDALKGIAIFLVVLGHSIIVYPINLHENVIYNFIFRWLSSVHVPLFFVVSGFCFSYKGNYKEYIIKKMKRLMVPYCILGVMDYLPKILFPNLVNKDIESLSSYLYDLFISGMGNWFLYTLFMVFLIYPLLYRIIIKRNIWVQIWFISFTLIIYYLFPSMTCFALSRTLKYLPYFTIGISVRELWGGKLFDIQLHKMLYLIFIVILLDVWIFLINTNIKYTEIVSAILGILTFYLCVKFKSVVNLFERFGKYSLQIYLLNGYMLVISRTIIITLLGITNSSFIILFNMIIDFGFSYIIIKYVLEKFKIIRFVMGME